MRRIFRPAGVALSVALVLTACGSSDGGTKTAVLETVSPIEASSIIEAGPADLIVLDVRTPEEVAEGHLADAVNLDFYATDFENQLDALDKDAPYVLYCRSGNRSGSTIDLMKDLGFTDVHEVDGGILSWLEAGLPIER